jgi:hypothetical protein
LQQERLSQRAIARTVGMSRNTVATILKKSRFSRTCRGGPNM